MQLLYILINVKADVPVMRSINLQATCSKTKVKYPNLIILVRLFWVLASRSHLLSIIKKLALIEKTLGSPINNIKILEKRK